MSMNQITINADGGKYLINRNIYGHFAEHLGRCIYDGIWVGEDSKIPNTRGMRNDIVAALKKTNIPVLRWPGGCFADEYRRVFCRRVSLAGRNRTARATPLHDQYALGRGHGKQPFRNA